jgi:hypothetical protein
MKTPEELREKLVQLMQEYQKNLTTLLEHPEWFREVVKGSKTIDEEETSHQDRTWENLRLTIWSM